SGPQGAQEENAARGDFPRDEAPRPLRETLRKEGPGEGGSDPPRPQACPQTHAARGTAADEAEADTRRPWRRTHGRAAPAELLIRPGRTGMSQAGRKARVVVLGRREDSAEDFIRLILRRAPAHAPSRPTNMAVAPVSKTVCPFL